MSAAMPFPRRHTVSTHEFLEMGSAGVFAPEARLELIAGEIIEMAPLGSPHAAVLRELTIRFSRSAGDRVIVSPQCPLVLGEGSVPQPDLALLKPSPDNSFRRHPHASDALLVVEVSDTTLRSISTPALDVDGGRAAHTSVRSSSSAGATRIPSRDT